MQTVIASPFMLVSVLSLFKRSKILLVSVALCLSATAAAQNTPSAEQMAEQLKKPATRSLRNLNVEAATSNAASSVAGPTALTVTTEPAKRPSLSLLIQFDFDSARIRPESQQALTNLSIALKSPELLASRFAVEGHTDAKGRADYNQRLSQQRAEAVRDFLAAKGINAQRLQAAGKGASELANIAEPSAAENRRVKIVNLD